MADPSSALAAHVIKYWTVRLPPGNLPVLTIGMVAQALQEEAVLIRCMQADGLRQLNPEDTASGWYAQLSYGKIVEVVLHGAAKATLIAASARVLSDGKAATKEGVLMGNRIAMLITEGLAQSFELVKKAGVVLWKVVSLLMAKTKVSMAVTSMTIELTKNAVSFGKRFAQTLAGSLKSILGTLGKPIKPPTLLASRQIY